MPAEKNSALGWGRKIGFRLSAAMLALSVTLLAGELGLALFTHRSTSLFEAGRYRPNLRATVYSPESGRVIAMRTNRLGFRGPNWESNPSDGKPRIAFIGDSFVAAVAVQEEETFVDLAGNALSERLGEPVESMNYGVSGRDLADYLMHYRLFVRQFRPRLVVVCFYHGNDLRGRFPELADEARPFDYEAMRSPETPGLNGWLLSHSRLYNWYTSSLRSARDRLRGWAVRRSPETYYAAMRERFERRWEDYRILLDSPDAATAKCWETIERQLSTFQREVERDGGQLLLVGIPMAEQAVDEEWHRLCQEGGRRDGDGWSRQAPDRTLGAIASRLGIGYLPLLPEFLQRQRESLYFGRGHLTPAGHQVAAESIVRRIAGSSYGLALRASTRRPTGQGMSN